jgi:NAD(P)-dependent dehydrogenase (short-subunit alcohol dehydrogenase family)
MTLSLQGKTVLISGATSGIGLETASMLACKGANVSLIGPDHSTAQIAAGLVRHRAEQSQSKSEVQWFAADFSSQAQLRRLAEEIRDRHERLHVLINNAGAVNWHRKLTEDGIEATFAVNHLAHFLLTNLLLELLGRGAPSRVVNVSSNEHRNGTLDFDDLGFERGYTLLKAYGRSKLACVLFTRELAKRIEGRGVTVHCVHPGRVATNIWYGAPRWAHPLLPLAKRLFMIPIEQGAQRVVHVATSAELEKVSGLYFVLDQPTAPSPLAQDDVLARRLWEESARLVKLEQMHSPQRSISASST